MMMGEAKPVNRWNQAPRATMLAAKKKPGS